MKTIIMTLSLLLVASTPIEASDSPVVIRGAEATLARGGPLSATPYNPFGSNGPDARSAQQQTVASAYSMIRYQTQAQPSQPVPDLLPAAPSRVAAARPPIRQNKPRPTHLP
jgi:hypothetical protein